MSKSNSGNGSASARRRAVLRMGVGLLMGWVGLERGYIAIAKGQRKTGWGWHRAGTVWDKKRFLAQLELF